MWYRDTLTADVCTKKINNINDILPRYSYDRFFDKKAVFINKRHDTSVSHAELSMSSNPRITPHWNTLKSCTYYTMWFTICYKSHTIEMHTHTVTLVQTLHIHTHIHPFNGPFSRTTRVSRYQKGKINLDFTKARDSEWQWHQLGHMQVCTLLQTDNHASTPPLSFYRPDALPAAQPTVSKHWRDLNITYNKRKINRETTINNWQHNLCSCS